MPTTSYTITDTTGDSGAVTVASYDIADTLTSWYPEAPAEVLEQVQELQDVIARGGDYGPVATYLGVTVEQGGRVSA